VSTVSEVFPYVIIAAAVVFAVVRRRRGSGPSRSRPGTGGITGTPAGSDLPVVRLLPLPGDVGLVAARDFLERRHFLLLSECSPSSTGPAVSTGAVDKPVRNAAAGYRRIQIDRVLPVRIHQR
jgi:hypothetical protein